MSEVPMTHAFDQRNDTHVRVCTTCDLWPDHHIHTGDTQSCGCDQCRSDRYAAIMSYLLEPGETVRYQLPPDQAGTTSTYEVHKYAAYLPVSDHLLHDSTDAPTPVIKATMRDRVHAWIYLHVRKPIASWIMGYPIDNPCDRDDE